MAGYRCFSKKFYLFCIAWSFITLIFVIYKYDIQKNIFAMSTENVSLMDMRQRGRHQLFQTFCEKKIRMDSRGHFSSNTTMAEIKNSTWFEKKKLSLQHVFKILHVNDDHRLMYCSVPKVASSSLKSLFMQLQGILETNKTQDVSLKTFYNKFTKKVTYLKKFEKNRPELLKRLNFYDNFLFVRNPFERLLSAYLSKLVEPMKFDLYMMNKYRKPIIKKYQPKTPKKGKLAGHGMEFISFIKFLLEKEIHEKKMNMHWSPYYYRCGLCFIDYNFIGHYETFDEDLEYLLNQKNITDLVKIPTLNPTKHGKSSSLLQEYYSQIPPSMIQKIYEKYRMDFEMFGYDYPGELKDILYDNQNLTKNVS